MAVAATAMTGSDQQVTALRTTYYGFSMRETAGAAAVVRIRSGGASGKIIDTLAFTADADKPAWYGPGGIACPDGIYVDIVSGAVEGAIFHS